jgi:hypothetical protein
MPDLVAELQLRFGVKARKPTFVLEEDERDTHRNKPVEVFEFTVWDWAWAMESYERQYADKEVLKVKSNGAKHLRLYAPLDVRTEMLATELPVSVPKFEPIKYVNFIPTANVFTEGQGTGVDPYFQDLVVVRPQFQVDRRFIGKIPFTPVPPSVELVGVYETQILETVTFSGDRVVYLKHSYIDNFAVAYASSFVTTENERIAAPIFVPALGAALVAEKECFGAIVIKYKIKYRLYKVNYGLPPTEQMRDVQLAWLKGDITTFPLPPVTVMAMCPERGLTSTFNFDKVIYPSGAYLGTWSTKSEEEAERGDDLNLSESKRDSVLVKVFDPEEVAAGVPIDERKYILVKRPKSVKMANKDGVAYDYRFAPPPADGSDGVPVA